MKSSPRPVSDIGCVHSKEQGAFLLTRDISESSLRRAIAHTCGMIDMIDESVGRIFAALDAEVTDLGLRRRSPATRRVIPLGWPRKAPKRGGHATRTWLALDQRSRPCTVT